MQDRLSFVIAPETLTELTDCFACDSYSYSRDRRDWRPARPLQPRWGAVTVEPGRAPTAASRASGGRKAAGSRRPAQGWPCAARRSGGRQTLAGNQRYRRVPSRPNCFPFPQAVQQNQFLREAVPRRLRPRPCSQVVRYCWLCLSRWAGVLGVRVRPGSLSPALFVPGLCLPVLYKTLFVENRRCAMCRVFRFVLACAAVAACAGDEAAGSARPAPCVAEQAGREGGQREHCPMPTLPVCAVQAGPAGRNPRLAGQGGPRQ